MGSASRIRNARQSDLPAIRDVVFTVGREFGFAPEPESVDADLFGDSNAYFSSDGLLRVLVDDHGVVCGMVGAVVRSERIVELRKLYLAEGVRGSGWGRRFVVEVIEHARSAGCKRIVLESSSLFVNALALYESCGFRRDAGDTRSSTCDVRMTLDLDGGAR